MLPAYTETRSQTNMNMETIASLKSRARQDTPRRTLPDIAVMTSACVRGPLANRTSRTFCARNPRHHPTGALSVSTYVRRYTPKHATTCTTENASRHSGKARTPTRSRPMIALARKNNRSPNRKRKHIAQRESKERSQRKEEETLANEDAGN